MRVLWIAATILVAMPRVGAQEATPNTGPAARAKSGSSVGKLNSGQKTDGTQQASPGAPPIPTCDQAAPCYVIEQPQTKSKEQQTEDDTLDTLYRRYLGATIIGVVGGLIGIGVLVWQTILVRRSTDAAKISADAARDSVGAVIAENRPWLLIPPNNGVQPPFLEPIERNTERFSHCIFRLKNYGKTPGKITAWNAQLQMGDSPGQPPNPLIYTDIHGATVNPQIIPQGQTIFPEAQLTPGGIIREDELDAVLTRHWKFLWLCGFVKYTDTFEKISTVEYETVFCLLYETRTNSPQPFWREVGPKEHNKAT